MRALKNILLVALSNVTTIISGIFVGFLVPKILSVEGYGYYKTFTLYVSYLGVCSLGIIDGIVLKYGAKDYADLNRAKFRSYFRWYIIIHSVFVIVMASIAYTLKNDNARIILFLLSINLVAVNVTGYFQQVSQITQRFKEYSWRKVLQSIINVIVIAILFIAFLVGHLIDYRIYMLTIVATNYLLMAWYIYTYHDIVFRQSEGLKQTFSDIVGLIGQGFPLLFANLCSTLLLAIDKQFVNILFTTNEYAVYAFGCNMLSLVTVATSAISTVLYPMLKRVKQEKFSEMYPYLVSAVLMVVYTIIVAFFPLTVFINWFLPKYSYSIVIFKIILPGVAMSSVVTVVMNNYYKVVDKSFVYFIKSIVIMVVSVAANLVAYLLFKTMTAISIASIITMIVWYIYVDLEFRKEYKQKCTKNALYAILMMLAFYICASIPNMAIGCVSYIACLLVFSILLDKELMVMTKYIIKG